MDPTSRLMGTGRSSIIFDDMACCRMKLLQSVSVRMVRHLMGLISPSVRSGGVGDAPQDTSIVRQASNRNPDVIVDSEHLLLIRCKLTGRTL